MSSNSDQNTKNFSQYDQNYCENRISYHLKSDPRVSNYLISDPIEESRPRVVIGEREYDNGDGAKKPSINYSGTVLYKFFYVRLRINPGEILKLHI